MIHINDQNVRILDDIKRHWTLVQYSEKSINLSNQLGTVPLHPSRALPENQVIIQGNRVYDIELDTQ